jgi:phosphate transport system substrate-binding protein
MHLFSAFSTRPVMMRLLVVAGLATLASAATTSIVVADSATPLSGTIKIDGSSTVYPILEAVAEEYAESQPKVRVTVGISGTGGGFKKFAAGETDLSNASRPVKEAERTALEKAGTQFIELPIAYDALSVIVHPENTWVESITTEELAKIWGPEAQGKITSWNQVRPSWPAQPIRLYGAGVDSGTFDYFTEAINHKEGASRGDYTSSEDDNVVVQGVSRDKYALGYLGLAYYLENKTIVKAVPVDDLKDDNGKGPQMPSLENVMAGVYQPLARPLFMYVRQQALLKPEVKDFVSFALKNLATLSKEVGYIPLTKEVAALSLARFERGTTGSIFASGGSQVGMTLEKLLSEES